MLPKYKALLTVAALVLLAGLGLLGLNRPATADEQQHNLRTLLETVAKDDTQVSIEFVRPLITGETSWSVPDEESGRKIGEIGEDYVCFTEPWNDDTRFRCTPFENIVGVNFIK